MYYKRILHVLAAKPGGGSAIYVNGVEKQRESEEMQEIVELSFYAGKHKSPWYGKINGYFFVKGFFDNKDDQGNEMTFSYCANTQSLVEGKRVLLSDLEATGYKLNNETLQCLDTQPNKLSTKQLVIAAIVLIAMILVLLKMFK